ncbi:MAG: 3,4-dihydroxy-2-butanone-4-phosphate synthase, partial [Rhodospirillales bacterium]
NEDGTMARMPDLVTFAQFHGLKIGTIADLIAYRIKNDRFVERRMESTFESLYGGTFTMYLYVNKVSYVEHVALVKGDLTADGPVPVRMHALNVLEDVLGDTSAGKASDLHQAMRMVGEAGRGVIVLLREPKPTAVSARLQTKQGGPRTGKVELRDYGVGAQILLDLGVTDMILLSNTRRTIVGLEGYGLKIAEQRPIPPFKGNNGEDDHG